LPSDLGRDAALLVSKRRTRLITAMFEVIFKEEKQREPRRMETRRHTTSETVAAELDAGERAYACFPFYDNRDRQTEMKRRKRQREREGGGRRERAVRQPANSAIYGKSRGDLIAVVKRGGKACGIQERGNDA